MNLSPILLVAFLIPVGVLAGVVSTVVSLASVVSYPALLALGLSPVSANVTNTVGLVFTSLGAAAGSRPELAGQRRRILGLGLLTCAGGALGAVVLLRTPARAFESLVPLLIALASATILVQPWLIGRAAARPRAESGAESGTESGAESVAGVSAPGGEQRPSRLWAVGVFAAAVYTGYFGAAGGVLQLAVLGGLFRDDLGRLNALKNVISGLANAVAAVGFTLFGPVRWSAAAPLAVGFLIGGRIGPVLARQVSPGSLRLLIAGCGFAVATFLAVRALG